MDLPVLLPIGFRVRMVVPFTATSKGKAVVLQHFWKLLEHREKWKLRGQKFPPPKKGRSNSPPSTWITMTTTSTKMMKEHRQETKGDRMEGGRGRQFEEEGRGPKHEREDRGLDEGKEGNGGSSFANENGVGREEATR
jgi:hypothetical protein